MDRKEGSSSSFTADLFGIKESKPSSSSGIFASIFPPPSTVLRAKSSSSELIGSWQKQHSGWNTKQGAPGTSTTSEAASYNMLNKEKKSIFMEERAEPCHLSSSIYYGGQDNYSQPTSSQISGHYPMFKKEGGEDDPNGSNSNDASRGNWWQGSLYY